MPRRTCGGRPARRPRRPARRRPARRRARRRGSGRCAGRRRACARRGHERDVPAGADDAAGERPRPGERVVVAERVDRRRRGCGRSRSPGRAPARWRRARPRARRPGRPGPATSSACGLIATALIGVDLRTAPNVRTVLRRVFRRVTAVKTPVAGWQARPVTDAPPAARAAVVVLAAGSGTRVGAEVNKVLLPLRRRPGRWPGRCAPRSPLAGRTPGGRRGPRRRGRDAVGRRGRAVPRRRARCCWSPAGRPGTPRSGTALRGAGRRHRGRRGRRGRDPRRRPGRWPAPPCSTRRSPPPREHGGAIPVVALPRLVATATARRRPAGAGRRADPAGLPGRRPARRPTARAEADGLRRAPTRPPACERYTDVAGRRRARAPPRNLKVTFPEDLGARRAAAQLR